MPSNWTKLALLALGAIFLCLTGNSASGSCGDYLHTRLGPPPMLDGEPDTLAQSHGNRNKSGSQTTKDQSERMKLWQKRARHHQPQPCSGPGCRSSRDQYPQPTAPTIVELTLSPKALTSNGGQHCKANGQSTLRFDEPTIRSEGDAVRIERPPQSANLAIGIAGITFKANFAPDTKKLA